MIVCQVDGCDRPHSAKGYCKPHYERVRYSGSPSPEAPISGRFPTWDYPAIWRACPDCPLCGNTHTYPWDGNGRYVCPPCLHTYVRDPERSTR